MGCLSAKVTHRRRLPPGCDSLVGTIVLLVYSVELIYAVSTPAAFVIPQRSSSEGTGIAISPSLANPPRGAFQNLFWTVLESLPFTKQPRVLVFFSLLLSLRIAF